MLLIVQTKFHADTLRFWFEYETIFRLCLTWRRLRRGRDEIMRNPVSNSLDARGEGDQRIVYGWLTFTEFIACFVCFDFFGIIEWSILLSDDGHGQINIYYPGLLITYWKSASTGGDKSFMDCFRITSKKTTKVDIYRVFKKSWCKIITYCF